MGSKFKVGDRIIRTSVHLFGGVKKGEIYTIKKVLSDSNINLEECPIYSYDPAYFELYKEEPVKQFDMKTQPWFIRVNNEQEFDLVQEWLKENFGTVPYFGWYPQTKGLTNTNIDGKMYSDYVMWFCDDKNLNQNTNEIKLRFKTTIDSVEWPIVESEKDKKIRELQETIKKAEEQLKELHKLS